MEPVADVTTLLRPRAFGTKVIHGAVRRSRVTYAGFGIVLAGECWLTVNFTQVRTVAGVPRLIVSLSPPGGSLGQRFALQ
jgi:hypothetical protein